MFNIDDLNIITRALTGYELEIKETIESAKKLEGSELLIEDLNKTLKEIRDVEKKTRDIKWKILTRKEE